MLKAGRYADGSHHLKGARLSLAKIFADERYNMEVKEVSWTFVAEDLPQTDRHMNHKAMLCVSKQQDNGKMVSAFAKSELWIRGGVVVRVPVLQPEQYVDPLGTHLECGLGATLSDKAVLKQHVSGSAMYQAVAALTHV